MKYHEVGIGQKVSYCSKNEKIVGNCTGTIIKLYPPDPKDHPGDVGFVCVDVDRLPVNWPYNGSQFTPSVNDLSFLV